MIKAMVFLSRRDGMSREEFERYMRNEHAALVTRLTGLRRLVINRVLPNPNSPPPGHDAVVEYWFDDLAAMRTAFASPEGQAVNADAPNFLDNSRFQLLIVEEEEISLPTETAVTAPG